MRTYLKFQCKHKNSQIFINSHIDDLRRDLIGAWLICSEISELSSNGMDILLAIGNKNQKFAYCTSGSQGNRYHSDSGNPRKVNFTEMFGGWASELSAAAASEMPGVSSCFKMDARKAFPFMLAEGGRQHWHVIQTRDTAAGRLQDWLQVDCT